MSDISPEVQVEEPVVAEEVSKPDVGARLRAAREALGMDSAAVANSLKLSKRQVEALEDGDWSKLPGHTFVRGFVRNYARVVQLDAATLLDDLDAPPPVTPQLHLPRSTTTVLPQTGRAQKRDYAAVLAGIVLISVAVVAYYVVPPDFWQAQPKDAEPAESAERPAPLFPPASGEAASESTPPPAAEPVSASAPVAAPASAATAGAPVAASVVTAAPAAQALPPSVAAAPGKGLKMKFAQPSWVEIRDRSGQIIFSQLNPTGSEREVEGQPPFVMVVGNAAHVTVTYQGRNIDLQPRSKDDVARVTVE